MFITFTIGFIIYYDKCHFHGHEQSSRLLKNTEQKNDNLSDASRNFHKQ